MRKERFTFRLAALQLVSLIIMSASFAAPAAPEGASLRSQFRMGPVTDTAIVRSKSGTPVANMKLDLRAPETTVAPDAYPSAPGNHGLGTEGKNGLSFQVPLAKPMSPAEAFATRVQREGVPLTRLWENKSALVSVGLNQKGHMGLWLIQKTH